MQGLRPAARALSQVGRLQLRQFATAAVQGLEGAALKSTAAARHHDFRPTLLDLEQHVFGGSKPLLLSYLLALPSATRTSFAGNVEWMRALGLTDDAIVDRLHHSAESAHVLKSSPLATRLTYLTEVLGVPPRAAVGQHWELLEADLAAVDRKVHFMERKGIWAHGGVRGDRQLPCVELPAAKCMPAGGARLCWVGMAPEDFCAALGCEVREFEAAEREWAGSERVHKYGLAP